MKKLIIISLLVFSATLQAQFNSGGIYWTGSTGAGTGAEIDFSNVSYFDFSLHPEVGYFIKNKIAVGAGIHTEFGLPMGGEAELYAATYDIYIGPNIRYYIPRASDWQFYIYGNLQYGIYQNAEYQFDVEYYRHQYYGFQAGPGVNYFFTERVALDAKCTYRFRHSWNAAMGGSHNLNRLYFEIGISVFFPSITFFDMAD